MSRQDMTQNNLKRIVYYDPVTGIFRSRDTGETIGYLNQRYLVATLLGHKVLLHRLAFLYMEGAFPPSGVDHINGDCLDNRWCNIRKATQAVNLKNQRLYKNNRYGVHGVSWDSDKNGWISRIGKNGKEERRRFKDFFEAVCWRKTKELEHGYHSGHGRF